MICNIKYTVPESGERRICQVQKPCAIHDGSRVEKLMGELVLARRLLDEVSVDSMGGTPDLFGPARGWDDWFDDVARFLSSPPLGRSAMAVASMLLEPYRVEKCGHLIGEGITANFCNNSAPCQFHKSR